ncbi:MAG: hypothetical protein ACAI38_22100 [Myxococcota bacterium]
MSAAAGTMATHDSVASRRRNHVYWLPLVLWTAYLAGLMALYRFGPYEWQYRNDPTLYGFIFIVHVASVVGYALGLSRPAPRTTSVISIDRCVRVLSVMSTLGILIGLAEQYQSGISILTALTDPATVRQDWIDRRGTSLLTYVALALSVAHFPLVATVFGHWKMVRTRAKWFALTTVLGMSLIAVWSGSRAGMHAVIVVALFFNFSAAFTGRAALRLRTFMIVSAVIIAGFAAYAGYVSAKRASKKTIDYSRYVIRTSSNLDFDHVFVSGAPASLEPILLSGSFYLSHGFDGLAACLHKPFIGVGFGLGHSAFLLRTWEKLTGDSSINSLSCYSRLVDEDGYSTSLWVTVYAWIWSDLGSIGTPFFFLLLGFAFALAWRDHLQQRGTAAAAWVLAWIVYTIAVIPIIFPPGDYGALLGYWGSGLFWAVSRSKVTIT